MPKRDPRIVFSALTVAAFAPIFPAGNSDAREFISAKIIEISAVKGGTEYVLLNQRCQLIGLLPQHRRRPRVAVGDQVRYAEQGKYLHLVDGDNKTYKLRYLSQSLMPFPPPISEKRIRIFISHGSPISNAAVLGDMLTKETQTDKDGIAIVRCASENEQNGANRSSAL